MARPAYGGRPTCEGAKAIDVRRLHREGLLRVGQPFSLEWRRRGEVSGGISARTEADALSLRFQVRHRSDAEWRVIQQRVTILWTTCHLVVVGLGFGATVVRGV